MKVRASVYDSEQDYTDDMNCNVYAFDGSSEKEYEEFLYLLTIGLKHDKVIVIRKTKEE
jgi:hypothetical protein